MRIQHSIQVAVKDLDWAVYLEFRRSLHVIVEPLQFVSHRVERLMIGGMVVREVYQVLRDGIRTMRSAHDTSTEVSRKPPHDMLCKQWTDAGRYCKPKKKHSLLRGWTTEWSDHEKSFDQIWPSVREKQ